MSSVAFQHCALVRQASLGLLAWNTPTRITSESRRPWLHTSRKRSHVCMSWGGDPEVERLRQENDRLQRELENQRQAKKYKDKEGGGFLAPLKALGRIFSPGKDTKDKPERRRSSGSPDDVLDEILSDLPLPLRVFGGLAGGIIKGVAGVLGEAFTASREDVAVVLEATEAAIRQDPQARRLLGGNIQCGEPFSSSYSSSNINGQVSKGISLQLPVSGTAGQGTVVVEATGDARANIVLEDVVLVVGNRQIRISISGGPASSAPGSSRSSPPDGVIDVEYRDV